MDGPRRDGGGSADAFAKADAFLRDASTRDAPRPDARPSDARPSDARPSDARPSDARPSDARPSDAPTDAAPAARWIPGAAPERAPRGGSPEQTDLPGGGEGPPVFTSNNPEIFTGPGFLYEVARASPTRGGESFPLSGRFGVYLHHVNRAGRPLSLVLLVTNPGTADVVVRAHGSGYNQTEAGGLGLGRGPDYRVALEWLTAAPATTVPDTALAPQRPLALWTKPVADGAEVDGRFEVFASAPVFVYLVVTESGDLNEAVTLSRVEAPGEIRSPGTPPPPFGREAGVYAHDTWRGTLALEVPAAPAHVSYPIDTATGSGHRQVQAFPALSRFADSSAEAVGMYGDVFDLALTLRATGPRRVRVWFAGDVAASSALSFQWNGPVRVDGQVSPLIVTPAAPRTMLAELALPAGSPRTVHLELPVPGLISISAALMIETY